MSHAWPDKLRRITKNAHFVTKIVMLIFDAGSVDKFQDGLLKSLIMIVIGR